MFNLSPSNSDREFIVECIRLYRELEILWNTKSKGYHDRRKKADAYEMLANKFRERYPEATKDDVKRKINSLRTCYRKELRKHLRLLKEGHASYEPTFYYYNEMRFLQEQESVSDSHHASVYMDEEIENDVTVRENTNIPQCESPFTGRKKKAVKLQKLEELMELACKHLKDKTDGSYHWAMACAVDLQKMEATQQVYAKKAIAEILMEGQLGLLHRHSVKINSNSGVEENIPVLNYDNVTKKYRNSRSNK